MHYFSSKSMCVVYSKNPLNLTHEKGHIMELAEERSAELNCHLCNSLYVLNWSSHSPELVLCVLGCMHTFILVIVVIYVFMYL